MRLEDLTQIGNTNPVRSIWDIAPITGKLIIGTGNTTDGNINAKMTIFDNGNVGIGTTTPSAELEISSSGNYFGNTLPIVKNTGTGGAGWRFVPGSGAKTWIIHATGSGNFQGANKLVFKTSDSTGVMTMMDNGNVGIGTNNPQAELDVNGSGYFSGPVAINTASLPNLQTLFPGNYQLAVNGVVIAVEYTAKVTNDWPDYVFKQKLMPWKNFQQKIDSLGHFPGLPSAKEVDMKKAIPLGKVQIGHLAITEYLYRYLAETKNEVEQLKKENEELKQKNEMLKQHNKDLEMRIDKIEKVINRK
jgi:hypothetical protein